MIDSLAALGRTTAPAAMLDGLASVPGPAMKPANVTAETSFAAALSAVSQDAVTTLRNAEGLSLKALQGETETREVVDAVMTAEQTLQAAIAIRDKIVSAYLEVSRMAI
jgi:flagellar hook-basal body complex protein FliE